METVSVRLTTAWPSPIGLRRPLEGVIPFSAEEAERIVASGAGEIVADEDEGKSKPSASAAKKKAASAPDTSQSE